MAKWLLIGPCVHSGVSQYKPYKATATPYTPHGSFNSLPLSLSLPFGLCLSVSPSLLPSLTLSLPLCLPPPLSPSLVSLSSSVSHRWDTVCLEIHHISGMWWPPSESLSITAPDRPLLSILFICLFTRIVIVPLWFAFEPYWYTEWHNFLKAFGYCFMKASPITTHLPANQDSMRPGWHSESPIIRAEAADQEGRPGSEPSAMLRPGLWTGWGRSGGRGWGHMDSGN